MQLKDICCAQSSNIALKDLKHNSGPYPIYGASGFITCVDFFKIDKPYVGVVKDGAGVGRVMLLPEKSSVIGTMQSIIPTAGTDAKYLSYLLDFLDLERYCSGATIPHIYFKDYGKETIPTHSPEQQQEISAALDKITKLIALRQGQLAKLDQLAKSRFIEMFGDPVTNPRKWNIKKISDFATVKIGPFGSALHADDYITQGHPVINPSHIVDGNVVPDNLLTISESKYCELSAYHLRQGDVVIGRRGEIGRAAVITDSGLLCGTGSMFVRISNSCRPDFLQKIISYPTFKAVLEDKAVGVTMKNLNAGMLETSCIPLPPLELQNEFATFVEQLDKSKVTIRKSIEKLETTYRALLQEYFG